jgi:hypothetical protein
LAHVQGERILASEDAKDLIYLGIEKAFNDVSVEGATIHGVTFCWITARLPSSVASRPVSRFRSNQQCTSTSVRHGVERRPFPEAVELPLSFQGLA